MYFYLLIIKTNTKRVFFSRLDEVQSSAYSFSIMEYTFYLENQIDSGTEIN